MSNWSTGIQIRGVSQYFLGYISEENINILMIIIFYRKHFQVLCFRSKNLFLMRKKEGNGEETDSLYSHINFVPLMCIKWTQIVISEEVNQYLFKKFA